MTRRALLRAGALVVPIGLATPVRSVPPATAVSVPDLRLPRDADDSAAITRALARGGPVYLPAGRGSGPGGAYLVAAVQLPPGATIFGDGPASVVRPTNALAPDTFHALSPSANTMIAGISLRDLTLYGHCETAGFLEHHHLLRMFGVSTLRLTRLDFRGFSGDGVCIGGYPAEDRTGMRRNADIAIVDCSFDGINWRNRNAISVTSGEGVVIRNCTFRRCSMPTMPGPIDFEADPYEDAVIDRITVEGCTFADCHGNVGQVSVMIPANVRHVPRTIRVRDNRFERHRGSGADIVVSVNRPGHEIAEPMDCVIEGNVGTDGNAGTQIYSGRGVVIRNNRWTGHRSWGFLGRPEAAAECVDILVSDRFDRCGLAGLATFAIHTSRNVRMVGNVFRDCGDGGAQSACIYLGSGNSSGLVLERNDLAANPRSAFAIRRDPDHRDAGRPLRLIGNVVGRARNVL